MFLFEQSSRSSHHRTNTEELTIPQTRNHLYISISWLWYLAVELLNTMNFSYWLWVDQGKRIYSQVPSVVYSFLFKTVVEVIKTIDLLVGKIQTVLGPALSIWNMVLEYWCSRHLPLIYHNITQQCAQCWLSNDATYCHVSSLGINHFSLLKITKIWAIIYSIFLSSPLPNFSFL